MKSIDLINRLKERLQNITEEERQQYIEDAQHDIDRIPAPNELDINVIRKKLQTMTEEELHEYIEDIQLDIDNTILEAQELIRYGEKIYNHKFQETTTLALAIKVHLIYAYILQANDIGWGTNGRHTFASDPINHKIEK